MEAIALWILALADRRFRRAVAIALAVGALFLAVPAGAASASPGEAEVKLGFLYNFTKFVKWPREAFQSDLSPITIGIAGDDALAASFAAILADKPVGGRAVQARRVADSGQLPNCHILFIRASSRRRVSDVVDALAGKPVLLVGEDDRFLATGGMVNFVLHSDRVRLEINLDSARKSRLKLSPKLVSIASRIQEPGP